jgi:hypothetical protein
MNSESDVDAKTISHYLDAAQPSISNIHENEVGKAIESINNCGGYTIIANLQIIDIYISMNSKKAPGYPRLRSSNRGKLSSNIQS